MPTLLPQQLAGLVVIATVESGGGIHRVSLAIDVGMSRTPPPQAISREDLVVVLRNPAEGDFEAIASPDPGPLPVHALRVVQARAEFTYAQGVNAPTELIVTLSGNQATFPMSQTLSQTAGLAAEPQVGDAYPTGRRWPWWWPIKFFKGRCQVGRFESPLNTSPEGVALSEYFEMQADSASRPPARCRCCEYREFVRGTFTDAAGSAVRFDMPGGPLDPSAYRENGAIDEFGAGKPGFYGHRNTSTPGDEYTGADGCAYRGRETVQCPPGETVHAEFVGLIVDRCRGRVAAKRTWVVDL
jgi:hypothetical protein